jgi:hypothetical protein
VNDLSGLSVDHDHLLSPSMMVDVDNSFRSSSGRSGGAGSSALDVSVLPTPDGSDGLEHRFEMDDEGAKMLLSTLPIYVRNVCCYNID